MILLLRVKREQVELRELADKLGSRAVARFGELTAKRKAAEEKLQQIEARLSDNRERQNWGGA